VEKKMRGSKGGGKEVAGERRDLVKLKFLNEERLHESDLAEPEDFTVFLTATCLAPHNSLASFFPLPPALRASKILIKPWHPGLIRYVVDEVK
jgi:hypothetical protein